MTNRHRNHEAAIMMGSSMRTPTNRPTLGASATKRVLTVPSMKPRPKTSAK